MAKVLIFGCGPAGLLSAQAARLLGHDPVIYSSPAKSVLGGAQYLHRPVPGITDDVERGVVSIFKMGTAEGYAEKLYGDPEAPTSWKSRYDQKVTEMAWDILPAYDKLWDQFLGEIQPKLLDSKVVERIIRSVRADLVVNTIPASALCRKLYEHHFLYQDIWVEPAFYAHRWFGLSSTSLMVYNGNSAQDWYRSSIIFGRPMTEWPSWVQKPTPGSKKVKKPLTTNCNCHPEILRAGRYGAWSKDELSTDAFERVTDALLKM